MVSSSLDSPMSSPGKTLDEKKKFRGTRRSIWDRYVYGQEGGDLGGSSKTERR